jgi:hypothetical protein
LALFIAAITFDRVGVEAGADAIASHAYVIALAAVALPLTLPSVRRMSIWILPAAAAGALVGYSALVGRGVFEPGSIHPATTELAFVALAAWLGHQLATNLIGLEDLMSSAAFGESPALDLEDPVAANEIHTEIARGRRHGRPIAVTVLAPTPEGLMAAMENVTLEIDHSVRARFLFGSLARTVAAQLRRSDVLFEHRPSGRLIVLSPETDQDGTDLLVQRILTATAATGIETRAGTATFPDDGTGFETLVNHAEADIEQSTAPLLRAVHQGDSA